MKRSSRQTAPAKTHVRCAIYTRKSTEEGLDQEYNSLDAQRDAGENYIKSQVHEGWELVPERYDDGGFTGANMDRPALRRLLADIEAGRIDAVIVYKVDRLSRSLLDFAKLMATFEQHNVSFVSVTQAFNTASSMGRLVLNVLLSFAQFEREMIAERTRDKIAAARRKGKWVGGMPILGYDVVSSKLVINPLEADRVRQIFILYLEHASLLTVVRELQRRGWTTKSWTTRKGALRGGKPFTKTALHQLLTNATYIGQVRHKDERHPGEHAPIVTTEVFQQVQRRLQANGRSGGRDVRNKHGALLRGLLRCGACNCGMSHSYTVKGSRRYRYYVCQRAQQLGWQACPAPSLPAGPIEQFVIDQFKAVGRDPQVIQATLRQARQQADDQQRQLAIEGDGLRQQCRADHSELLRLVTAGTGEESQIALLGGRLNATEQRLTAITQELTSLDQSVLNESDAGAALANFTDLWDCLTPREQARIIELLVEQVTYVHQRGSVAVTLRSTGINLLLEEQTRTEDVA